ncbi:hypothetical protein, conserved, partial [Plasmodium ovale curtisi]
LFNKNNLVNIPFSWDKTSFDFSKCLPDISKFKSASKELANKGQANTQNYVLRLANLYVYATKIVQDNNNNPLNVSIKINNINIDSLKPNEYFPNGNNSLLTCPLNIVNFKAFNVQPSQSIALYQRLFIPESSNLIDSKNLIIEITSDQGYNVGNYFFYAKMDCPKTDTTLENEIKYAQTSQLNLLQNGGNGQQVMENNQKNAENSGSTPNKGAGTFQLLKSTSPRTDFKYRGVSNKSTPSWNPGKSYYLKKTSLHSYYLKKTSLQSYHLKRISLQSYHLKRTSLQSYHLKRKSLQSYHLKRTSWRSFPLRLFMTLFKVDKMVFVGFHATFT